MQKLDLTVALTLWGLTAFPLTPAFGGQAAVASVHIRIHNARIEEAFAFAAERSTTFRTIVDTLERSTDVVYVEEGRCGAVRACVHLLPATGRRYMLIHIDPRQPLISVVGQLAHELWHAAEIVADSEVTDSQSLQRLYARIGFESARAPHGQYWETHAARDAEARAMKEARAGGSLIISTQ
jgi:hypothetical protein